MKAFYAGSFDPFTIGHKDIVERVLKLKFDVLIGVGYNETKKEEWDIDTRLNAIKNVFENNPHITVVKYQGLTVEAAKQYGATFLVRGVRNAADFELEKNLADVNREISGIETLILIADPSLAFISSSMVRELLHNGYDVSNYIAGKFPDRAIT